MAQSNEEQENNLTICKFKSTESKRFLDEGRIPRNPPTLSLNRVNIALQDIRTHRNAGWDFGTFIMQRKGRILNTGNMFRSLYCGILAINGFWSSVFLVVIIFEICGNICTYNVVFHSSKQKQDILSKKLSERERNFVSA